MAITININGLSLCHRGSGGVSKNTIPNVCKTPPHGKPFDFDNIAYSKDLVKGTGTVFADGGNMIANFGSEFAISEKDEPGSMGGVDSETNLAEADWISHSFDVFFEGKPACRLTDKMFHNHRNSANLAGLEQAPLEAWPELMVICKLICLCNEMPLTSASGESDLKQECVEKALIAADDAAKGTSPIKAEIPYNMTTIPPSPILTRQVEGVLRATQYLPRAMKELALRSAAANGGMYDVRIPDAVITRTPGIISASSLMAPNLKVAVEIKFNNQPRDPKQIFDYGRITGSDATVIELSPKACKCELPEPAREPVLTKARAAAPAVEEKEKTWLDRYGDYLHTATGMRATGATLIGILLISEISRIFPPRNAVPVP